MRRILALTSGRHDRTPMIPILRELQTRGVYAPLFDIREKGDEVFDAYWDMVLLLGDRWETLAAALKATIRKIPIAHIHGGEATFGSFDNQIRDALTKLSHIHCVAADEFRDRLVIGLSEDDWRVHVTGAPGLDNLFNLPERVPEKYFVCTFHPATLSQDGMVLKNLLTALDEFFPNYKQIWTGTNNDPGHNEINNLLADRDVRKLTDREYHLLCRNAAAVVGNSSSGIIEAPTIGVPSVDIGDRQLGRPQGPSTYHCSGLDLHRIAQTIEKALDHKGPFDNPYGEFGASSRIADVLAEVPLVNILVKEWSA